MANLITQLSNYRLTTAHIIYHLPDHPQLLQSYVWQEYDVAPRFPELKRFLDFWSRELDGKLHSVYIASKEIITTSDTKFYDLEVTIQ
ncbi:MAG: Usg family protein [Alphaproteobacteria bacterium]|nr:Usg family protein [Alphaproteobacteria bacterium]